MLPNFLVIGANRSGTTYLKRNLESHPDIFMANASYTGDIHFFNSTHPANNWSNGIGWYEDLFSKRKAEKCVGEKSSLYLSDPKAAERIKATIPHAKIIVILRNPIETAYSYYWFDKAKIPAEMSFIEACKASKAALPLLEESLLHPGFYYKHLSKYLGLFNREQMEIVLFDDLINRPVALIKTLYKFLGVDINFQPKELNKVINAGTQSIGAYSIPFKVWNSLKSAHPRLTNSLKQLSLVEKLRIALGKKAESRKDRSGYRAIQEGEIDFLWNAYKKDIDQLGSILNIDLINLWGK